MTLACALLYEDGITSDDIENDESLRRWCGSAEAEGGQDDPDDGEMAKNCVAPLVRFDASRANDDDPTPILHGLVEMLDDVEDRAAIIAAKPTDQQYLPNLKRGARQRRRRLVGLGRSAGIRAKVLRVNPDLEGDGEDKDEEAVDMFDVPERVRAACRRSPRTAPVIDRRPDPAVVGQERQWRGHRRRERRDSERQRPPVPVRHPRRRRQGRRVAAGRAAAMIVLGDTTEVLLGGLDTNNDTFNKIDYEETKQGFVLPAEFGIAFYKRVNDHRLLETFTQIDGRTSEKLNAGARLFLTSSKGADEEDQTALDLTARIKDVPAFGANGGITQEDDDIDPSFRLALEVVGDGHTDYFDPHKIDGCELTQCLEVDMGVTIDLDLDFQVDDNFPAKRIDVQVRKGYPRAEEKVGKKTWTAAKNGLAINVYNNLTGETDVFNPADQSSEIGRAPIDGRAYLTFNPLKLHWHRGIMYFGSVSFDLLGRMDMLVKFHNTWRAVVQHHLLNLRMTSEGPPQNNAMVFLGPVANLDYMSFDVWALFIPIINIFYVGPNPALMAPLRCPKGGEGPIVDNGDTGDFIINVLTTGPQLVSPQGLDILIKVLGPLFSPFFCFSKPQDVTVGWPCPGNLPVGHPGARNRRDGRGGTLRWPTTNCRRRRSPSSWSTAMTRIPTTTSTACVARTHSRRSRCVTAAASKCPTTCSTPAPSRPAKRRTRRQCRSARTTPTKRAAPTTGAS